MNEALESFTREAHTERRADALIQSITRKLSDKTVADESAGLLQASATRKGLKFRSFALSDIASLPSRSALLITDASGAVTRVSLEQGRIVAKEARTGISDREMSDTQQLRLGSHLRVFGAINDKPITEMVVVFDKNFEG
jgi:hypothetical protein